MKSSRHGGLPTLEEMLRFQGTVSFDTSLQAR